MSAHVVLVVGRDWGRLALVEASSITRSLPFRIAPDTTWSAGVAGALAAFGARKRLAVTVLLAPSLMPTHCWNGEAGTPTCDELRSLFLAVPDPLCVAGQVGGSIVAAQVDRGIIKDLLSALTVSGLTPKRVLPQVAVLSSAALDLPVAFHDGAHVVHVDRSHRVRRLRSELVPYGEAAVRTIRDAEPSTWVDITPSVDLRRQLEGLEVSRLVRPVGRAGRGAALALLTCGIVFGATAPLLLPAERARRIQLDLNARQADAARRAELSGRSRRAIAELRALEAFTRQESITLQLGALTRTLPPQVFVTTLQLDSNHLVLGVRGTDVGELPDKLREALACRHAAVVGAVTQEPGTDGRPAIQGATLHCTFDAGGADG